MLHQAALGEIVDQRRKRPVELAQLLKVKLEVLVVRVVVAVLHLHIADALLNEPARQQAVLAEVRAAEALVILL